MEQGTIVRVTDRGFGFISPANGGKDYFFHANEVQNAEFNSLREGDAVTFEVADGPKGPSAVNITVGGAAAPAGDDMAAAPAGDDMADETPMEAPSDEAPADDAPAEM